MKNRSSYAVLTRFGIIAAVLATLVLIAPAVSAADPLEFDYDENGTISRLRRSVRATLTQTRRHRLEFERSRRKAIFEIDGGVLTFKNSPDFEKGYGRETKILIPLTIRAQATTCTR